MLSIRSAAPGGDDNITVLIGRSIPQSGSVIQPIFKYDELPG